MSELNPERPLRQRGFTLVELMVTMSVLAVMSAIALPSFQVFMAENRAQGKAVELAAALKTAQTEALRRNRQVVFTLTSSVDPSTTLAGNAQGKSWASAALPLANSSDSTTPTVINVGGFTENAADVALKASSAGICFLPDGTLKANTATGITTANCTVDSSTGANVRVYASKGNKVWQVIVTPMGRISTCLGKEDASGSFACV
ncbi:GspH/FimT family pseudopilin [Comamonas sp.]|uniref:GspH/FimT family pseudopilin n=1 Tax=Comamonas sp. TaxID=34028 RepID=UPI00289F6E33|nr:GspH/FimT family pseudopilin [Comamonas sp.]